MVTSSVSVVSGSAPPPGKRVGDGYEQVSGSGDQQGQAFRARPAAESLDEPFDAEDEAGLDRIGPPDGGSRPVDVGRGLPEFRLAGDRLDTVGNPAEAPEGQFEARVMA